ncbi:MAG: beta-ketoacyl synthase [Hapalosiphonaceae cyanobacterium JJU2]|nr:MAG: beta-ketoacyl synthase [Hapalosiphonaceae cyanobacterium JJU2]
MTESIQEILSYRAQHQSDQQAFIFLEDGETESGSLTYGELDRQARAIAAQLLPWKDERALLLYPPGLEFITAFFGCLYAGVVAVPAYPPRPNQSLKRLQTIAADAQATIALTTTAAVSNLERQISRSSELKALRWIVTDNVNSDFASTWQDPHVDRQTIAFLQYTSGSTGNPKGVIVSHGNLLHNQMLIQQAMEHTEKTVFLSWLPLFHDMGLVGNVLQPVFVGCRCILMPPVAFLQRPLRWLEAVSHYKATTSGGPNFAYDLCTRKITPEKCETLDLSSWEVAFNGAETIRAETIDRFTATFGQYGFRREAFFPCYGMAETTLIISGGHKTDSPVIQTFHSPALEKNQVFRHNSQEDIVTQRLVGCGHPLQDLRIVITHPDTLTLCAPDEVGEIWVSGSSVAQGYWRCPEETEQTFRACLVDSGEGPFLRTGDLGFLKDGELFVTGRLKDLIIIRGLNHYPQDIEGTVERCHPALRVSCNAAFGINVNNEERLVVVQEVERSHLRRLNVDELVGAIRQNVAKEHDLEVYSVLLLRTGAIPKTSSGKIQRYACKAGFLAESLDVVGKWQQVSGSNNLGTLLDRDHFHDFSSPVSEIKTAEAIQVWLATRISEQLNIPYQNIDIQQPFEYYGLGSLEAVGLSGELENWLGRKLSPILVYDYPSIKALAQYLSESTASNGATSPASLGQNNKTEAIAIVGIGCRFPGAENLEAFWQLLSNGVDAIREVPESRWDINAFYDSASVKPGKMKTCWGGFLDQVDQFDAQFFNISPREAERMDPQQRLLLEVGWEALENAGQCPVSLSHSRAGVYIGISNNDYSRFQFENPTGLDAYTGTGNAFSIAANRLSYVLDLNGPSLAVDTACSSSLVAVHLACQSLLEGECDLALAGGVNLILSPELTISFSQAGILATDGRCKAFDAAADGYVRGEGCGIVVLKRLSDALSNRDNILAVIKGSAVNQDGRSNGLTAPNGLAQKKVIRQALEKAGVAPAELSYIEAHGTGTILGDPIELNSLREVLMQDRLPNQPCWIGSVKTNIGHLEAAAGIAGLIKVVLSLQHKEITPHLHFKKLNPHILLEGTTLSIPTKCQTWSSPNKQQMAGVSSFGLGGTNAHLVIEATESVILEEEVLHPKHLLTLSAKSEQALRELALRYEDFLTHPNVSLADICFTANTGRAHFAYRQVFIAESIVQLRAKLKTFTDDETVGLVNSQIHKQSSPKIAFLFTGQGSQYVNMGRQLFETQPVFRQTLLQCNEILYPFLEKPLLEVLYPEAGEISSLDQTLYAQPALFILEYAIAKLWQSWGIEPTVVMGHSVGEYTAACVAGVISLEDGLKLIAKRASLIQSLPQNGQMVVVFAPKEQVEAAVAPYADIVALAAINGPENIVISGARDAIQDVLKELHASGIQARQLPASHAFHSPLMDPILEDFEQIARQVSYSSPQKSLVSCMTGQLAGEDVTTPEYWCNHVRQPVRFATSMETLHKLNCELFIEIGSSPVLLGMGRQCLPENVGVWLPSLRQGQEDWQQILQSLSSLYMQGIDINWSGFYKDYSYRRVALPTYPFERQRYWLKTKGLEFDIRKDAPKLGITRSHPLLGFRLPEQANLSNNYLWQVEVSKEYLPYLKDHCIQGVAFMPGGVYLEMISAAVAEVNGEIPYELSEIEYKQILFLPEKVMRTLQVILSSNREDGNMTFYIYSRASSIQSEPWDLHATGKIIWS